MGRREGGSMNVLRLDGPLKYFTARFGKECSIAAIPIGHNSPRSGMHSRPGRNLLLCTPNLTSSTGGEALQRLRGQL